MTPEQERDCLRYPLFQDDFGSPGDRALRDKIVTVRAAGECHNCAQPINIGTRARRTTMLFDGAMRSYAHCQPCCEAMALSWTDAGNAICARYSLRHETGGGK